MPLASNSPSPCPDHRPKPPQASEAGCCEVLVVSDAEELAFAPSPTFSEGARRRPTGQGLTIVSLRRRTPGGPAAGRRENSSIRKIDGSIVQYMLVLVLVLVLLLALVLVCVLVLVFVLVLV